MTPLALAEPRHNGNLVGAGYLTPQDFQKRHEQAESQASSD